MTVHNIAILCIMRLMDAIQDTVTSSEFKALKVFDHISYALLQLFRVGGGGCRSM